MDQISEGDKRDDQFLDQIEAGKSPPWSTNTILICSVFFSLLAGVTLAYINVIRILGYNSVRTIKYICGLVALASFGILSGYIAQHNPSAYRAIKIVSFFVYSGLIVRIYSRQRKLL